MISVIVCALVPDYISLLMSRILIGISIAVSMTPLTVYMSEISPNKQFYVLASVLLTLGYASCGGWCGILGYLFLERVGWRWFVLLTSVPLFIPSILAFHLILPETQEVKRGDSANNNSVRETVKLNPTKRAMITKMIKLNLQNMFRGFPYYGCILLVPSIFKEDNIKNDRDTPCHAMFGIQFLTMTLVFGVCQAIGKVVGYLVDKCGVSVAINFATSIVTIISLLAMLKSMVLLFKCSSCVSCK